MKKLGLVAVACLTLCACQSSSKETETKKESVTSMITLPSGLKYQILNPGAGKNTPQRGQKVTVHYAGWLEDSTKPDGKGSKFDSSVDRGQKFTFNIGIGQVIKGWDEGVMGMVVGEKRLLVIPSQLAYGDAGIPGAIPPQATLIFEVELFDIS